MKPLRVTMLCSSTSWGGTEKWALRASEELLRQGHVVSFIARKPEMFRKRERTPNAVGFIRFPLANDLDFISLLRLTWYLKRNSDVLIATRVRDYWLGGLAAKLAGVPELLRLGVMRKPREKYWRDLWRYGSLPGAIVVNARAIRDQLAETPFIDPARVQVIYNGVETPGPAPAEQRAAVRSELGAAQDEILIAAAGRLAVEKRWHWVIEAVSGLRKREIPARAVIFGEGDEHARLNDLVHKLMLEDVVRFPGVVADPGRYLGAADVVVLTSSTEGISNAMLEALGRGVAVVATSAGGAAERLESGRDLILVPSEDKTLFFDQLARVCTDAALRETSGRQGMETVRREFSWERMGAELETLLTSLVEAKR